MRLFLLVTAFILALALSAQAGWRDSVAVDTATATFGDPTLYTDATEKPLWFFLDSLSRDAGWLPAIPDSTEKRPRVGTRRKTVGLLEGFDLHRVDYVLQYSKDPHVDSLQTGTLLLLEIWPGLHRLIGHYATFDAPDSIAVVILGDQEAARLLWQTDEDSTRFGWEQYLAWHRLDERPVDLEFAARTQQALDETLPPGYYAAFAGTLNPESLCFKAPVYAPADEFGEPSGGAVEICYSLTDRTFTVEYAAYSPPE